MIQVFRPLISESAIAAAAHCMREGWIGYGPRCKALERQFSATNGGGWALATSSCTTALHMAGLLLQPARGDEVIVPAVTFVATPMAFLCAGWNIRIGDVDPSTLLLTADSLAAAVTERTRAVVAVHLYGQRAATAQIADFCRERALVLVEDAAHRLPLPGEPPPHGTFVCYSFNAVKEAPAGEGGLLWCRDLHFEAAAREISNVGLLGDTLERAAKPTHRDYDFGERVGLKLRLNDIGAAMVLEELAVLADERQRRAQIAQQYDELLAGLAPALTIMPRRSDDSHLMYVVRVDCNQRDAMRSALAAEGIATSVHYPSLSRHQHFATFGCPSAEAAGEEVVTLPLHLGLTCKEQRTVIEAISRWAHL